MRVAVVFPGQGTQAPGMGAAWQDHPAWKIVEQAEAALRPVAIPAVECLVALLAAQHTSEVTGVAGIGVPARDGVAIGFAKAAQCEALGFDHSVSVVIVSVTVGRKPTELLMCRIARFSSAFDVETTSTSG